jgi:hypothetical protein
MRYYTIYCAAVLFNRHYADVANRYIHIEEQLMLQIYQNNVVLLEDKHHIAMFSTEEHLARSKS